MDSLIKLNEEHQKTYKELIKAAQSIEASLGSAYYKITKMAAVREQVDNDLKNWWEKVTEEYKIDKTKSYYVTQDGEIKVVEDDKARRIAAGAEVTEDKDAPTVTV
jgi:hypothetical protein